VSAPRVTPRHALLHLQEFSLSVANPRVGLAAAIVLGVLLTPLLWLVGRARRSAKQPWVIGGHRGRMLEDNSGALYDWITTHSQQPILWVADRSLAEHLQGEGKPALVRSSWRARLAIFSAPVLVYSHGDDDLDPIMHLWRGLTGQRYYLNHSLNVFKAGNAHTPEYQGAGALKRWWLRRAMTDFDVLLASSPFEAQLFHLAFPHLAQRVLPRGGGAHLDGFMRLCHTPPARHVYWFPTHRDDDAGNAALQKTMQDILANETLREWLLKNQFTFRIGTHINTGDHHLSVQPPFERRTPVTIKADLAAADVLISDYSGLIANFMVFDRPAIAFPFDREHYLRHRFLYTPIEDIATGPICMNVHELVHTLKNGDWHDNDTSRAKRADWQKKLFVHHTPVYAQECYRTICRLQGVATQERS